MDLKKTLEILALAGTLSLASNVANAQEKIPRQIQRLEYLFEFPASLKCKYESNLVTVEKDNSELHHETLVLPKGIKLKVMLDKYLILFDSLGEKFRDYGLFGEYEADTVFIYLNPFEIKENKLHWDYDLGGLSSGFKSFQDFVDETVLNGIYKSEFDKKNTKVKINDKELLVRGPNRNDEFELTSGKSSLIYNPRSNLAKLKLGRAFNTQVGGGGAVSEIISYDLDKGIILVEDMYKGKSVLWELKLNFNNKDPNNSYTARKLEENIIK